MKNASIICSLLLLTVLGSCKKNQETKDAEINANEKPVSVACYQAFYESDTIDLKLNTLKNGKINGDMAMKLSNRPLKLGKIEGKFRGDTLFVDYSFVQGANDKVMFKNPMAFLKRNEELILGNGKIETYLGSSYFAKGVPIDFDNVKYKFSSVDCKN